MAVHYFSKGLEAAKSTTAYATVVPVLDADSVAVSVDIPSLGPSMIISSRIKECADAARDAGYAAAEYSVLLGGGTVEAAVVGTGDVGAVLGANVQAAKKSVLIDSALMQIRDFIRENY